MTPYKTDSPRCRNVPLKSPSIYVALPLPLPWSRWFSCALRNRHQKQCEVCVQVASCRTVARCAPYLKHGIQDGGGRYNCASAAVAAWMLRNMDDSEAYWRHSSHVFLFRIIVFCHSPWKPSPRFAFCQTITPIASWYKVEKKAWQCFRTAK